MAADVQFPLNLPQTFTHLSPCGCELQAYLGESISGVGSFLNLYDKYFPAVRDLLVRCVGEGIGQRTVGLIATIVITLIGLPIFCSLTLLYNMIAGGIKAGYGLKEYLSKSDDKSKELDAKCMRLFKEASQHLCFAGLDLIGVTAVCWLFAGAFAFGGKYVKEKYEEVAGVISSGQAFDQMRKWVQPLKGGKQEPSVGKSIDDE